MSKRMGNIDMIKLGVVHRVMILRQSLSTRSRSSSCICSKVLIRLSILGSGEDVGAVEVVETLSIIRGFAVDLREHKGRGSLSMLSLATQGIAQLTARGHAIFSAWSLR